MPFIAEAIRPAVVIIAQHGSSVSAAGTGFGTSFGTAAEVALTLLDSANNATPLGTYLADSGQLELRGNRLRGASYRHDS